MQYISGLMLTSCDLTSAGDEMPSSVWLSHDKQKKLHSFLEHLFSQVGQLNICTDVIDVESLTFLSILDFFKFSALNVPYIQFISQIRIILNLLYVIDPLRKTYNFFVILKG